MGTLDDVMFALETGRLPPKRGGSASWDNRYRGAYRLIHYATNANPMLLPDAGALVNYRKAVARAEATSPAP